MNVARMRRPGRRARRVLAGGLVAAVVGVGYVAYSANADAPSYRTATATAGDVEQTLDVSGSVEPAGRADLAFATSGTIASITVATGDTVKAGAVLGRLDDTSLRKDLQQARATLANAKAQLESDEDAQATTVSAAASSSSTSASTGSTTKTPTAASTQSTPSTPSESVSPSTGPDPLADLAAEQQAVTGAQSTVSASLTAAQEALAAQQTACTDAFTDDSTETTDTTEADQACTDALTAVQAAQQQVSTDQDALQAALEDLAGTLTEALASLQQAGGDTSTEQPTEQPTTQQPTAQESTQPTTQQPSQSSQPSTGSTTVSASTLARDQASIDQAKADLITAQQALRTATVTAPFAGKVVAVDAGEGDSVASGTEVFVLVAPGTTTVQVEATSTQVQQLAVGQDATATPVGSDQALEGTVTQISTVPDDSSTYPVTITLTKKHLDIATGLNASVSIVTGTANDVVTVPASAVTDGSVLVVGDDGTASRARVTTGVVGTTTVEVTEGLDAGDEVVLADLDEALPTTDDSSTGGFSGFGGDFPSGGFGGPPTGGGPPAIRGG